MKLRVGNGYDVHRLEEGRKLILCGVEVPYEKGLLGHSDADVATHALIDALLGAAGLGDIGSHFPDTDPAFKGADSRELLREAIKLVREAGWEIVNVDATIVAQAPKLAPYMPQIQQSVADCLGVAMAQVNVKAKTKEKCDAVGEGLAIETQAIALLQSIED